MPGTIEKTRIPPPLQKQPNRPHFIKEWAEKNGYKTQAALADAVSVDKGTVSRWFSGGSPMADAQRKLAELFHIEPESLFMHPDHEWFARFLMDRPPDEVDRIKRMLELAFPVREGDEH